MSSKTIKRTANTFVHFFQSQGIKVMRYNAYSTNSIYLKLDYGLLYTLRISDHPGKQYLTYRFNVIQGYRGPKRVRTKWGWQREFYRLQPDDLNHLCLRLLQMRNDKMLTLGPYQYQQQMDYRKWKHKNEEGFWQQARDLG